MSTAGTFRLFVTHWELAPALDVQATLCVAIYLWATLRTPGRWPVRRTASFMAGVGCVLIALQSGLDAYDDRLLSVHMTQHMLLLLLAPLLLLGGQPLLLALRIMRGRQRRAFAKRLRGLSRATGPLQCLAVFTAVILATHLPGFYDATLRHPALHDLEHVMYLLAGLLMWWPIVGADPVPAHRLGGLGRLVYMLATMPPMALIGAYLNRQPTLVYPLYGPASHALGVSPLVDQAQAGAIMWVAGSMIVTVVGLAAVLAALVAEEHRQQLRDARMASIPVPRPDPGGGEA